MMRRYATELSQLHATLKDLSDAIGQVERPIDTLDGLLGRIKTALTWPQQMSKDLKSIEEILATLEDLAEAAEWMPEIGEAASSLVLVLKPLVKEPPPSGAIGEMRKTLDSMQSEILVRVSTMVDRLKKPVDQVKDAVAKVHGKVAFVLQTTENLLQRYGAHPPAGVEACARQLNADIGEAAEVFDDVKDYVVQHTQSFLDALGQIETEFDKIEGYFRTVQNAVAEFEKSTFRQAMNKFESFVNKAKHAAKWMIESIAKALGIDLSSMARFLTRVEAQMAAFVNQAIDAVLSKMKGALRSAVDRIPGVDQLEQEVQKAEDTLDSLRTKFDDFLGSECAKTLGATESGLAT